MALIKMMTAQFLCQSLNDHFKYTKNISCPETGKLEDTPVLPQKCVKLVNIMDSTRDIL